MAHIEDVVREEHGFSVPGIPFSSGEVPEGAESGVMAPLIFNAWYVVALSKDVGRSLGAVKVLGQPLVHFRAEDGQPVVLDDRCLHRRYSLSKGQLKGDTIACGYHGFTYERTGQCVWAPGVPETGDRQAKLPFGIRSYPCAERGPWLWVWMGEPSGADSANIPLPQIQPGHSLCGYKMNPANYMMLIENLLDLSHVHFLHGAADLEHANTIPRDAPAPVDGVAWRKILERTEQGGLVVSVGGDPNQMVRLDDSVTQYGPSLTVGCQRRDAFPGDPPAKPGLFEVAHALTPQDEHNTHQFFMVTFSDPFAIDEKQVLSLIEGVVFEQDVQVVRSVQANVVEDERPGRIEVSMASDRWGIKMRKILKEMKAREVGG